MTYLSRYGRIYLKGSREVELEGWECDDSIGLTGDSQTQEHHHCHHTLRESDEHWSIQLEGGGEQREGERESERTECEGGMEGGNERGGDGEREGGRAGRKEGG